MLTKNEVTALNLSPTKKDFVQIWNELLDVSKKLSERWDPTSTNESDPGIVLLKALTGIADKLNYNIDKNTLEAFMPTAAQEESMRKLCDMLGYNIKYFQSATTKVNISYYNAEPSEAESEALAASLEIPKFTVITNVDKTISYFTINKDSLFMNSGATNLTVDCMEGQVVKCSSINENSLITENLITTDNRFYLPETQIAENGIFVYSAMTIEKDGKMISVDGKPWTKVDNLNTAVNGSTVYKFGFDSFEGRPFIEFKDDYSELFGAGLYIYYTRTSGANGNVSPRTLTVLESPGTTGWDSVSMESFTVENPSATNTGVNPETISQAYKNFKKTIGTFDTLVTCRDYMNKIYSFMTDENKPYVSNVLVTDIRNDLNRAITICTADDSGIFYHEVPLYKQTSTSVSVDTDQVGLKPAFNNGHWYLGTTGLKLDASVLEEADTFRFDRTGTSKKSDDGYWWIDQDISEAGDGSNVKSFKTTLVTSQTVTVDSTEPAIDHFDLVIYPFKSYNQVKSNVKDIRAVYDSSFTYTASTFSDIQTRLETEAISTIAHAYKQPQPGDIVSINNYLKLNALISTNTKLTVEEGTLIIEKIKFDLANAFNMRELDFGEEIPVDAILKVIESADSRIRIVSLAEPALYTTFSVLKNYDEKNNAVIAEYAVASEAWLTEEAAVATKRFRAQNTRYAYDAPLDYFDTCEARRIYNYLVLRNVLAGRVPLFNYDNTFSYAASEAPYLTTSVIETGIPEELTAVTLTAENPIAMVSKDGDIYTKLFTGEGNDPVVQKTTNPHIQYDGGAEPIQKLETFCNINAPGGVVKDVELADGEYIKFRAPNFITKATYPAYVNYHLHLNNTLHTPADPAVSTSLFDKLNVDHDIYDATDPIELMWHKVLAFFGAIDLAKFGELAYGETPQADRLVKSFALQQRVSAATTTEGGIPAIPATSTVYVAEGVTQTADGGQDTITPEQWLAESGCVRLLNPLQDYTTTSETTAKAFAAELTFDDGTAVQEFSFCVPVYSKKDGVEHGTLNNFIIDAGVFSLIKQCTDDELRRMNDAGTLPTKPWTLAFNFECVPFTTASLEYWEAFVQGKPVEITDEDGKVTKIYPGVHNYNCTQDTNTWGSESEAQVVANHFEAKTDERERLFWRIFEGGYEPGKCVDSMRNKYLPIDPSYIRSLPDQKTQNAYILTTLGVDAEPEQINNDEEYQLMQGEKLYFEYTPSTQTVDGASETLPPVTKVFGEGTIIRPSGFEPGLIDSEALKTSGKSYVKSDVVFKTDTNSGSEIVKLHSLGANEQIEIRDFAKVELPNDKLQVVYMYKNFDCDILENWDYPYERSYTLKDGEYIFYTDNNKVELAFFTTGTKVTLTGSVVIPRFDKIEIATILDTGITEIPWRYIPLTSKEDKITFLEYQYVTLGKKDKLGTVVLSGNYSTDGTVPQITSEWTPCEKDATYYLAADPTKEVVLPSVRLADGIGGGWEVCSVLELEASPTNTQTLRRTDKIQTGLNMFTYADDTEPVATLTPTLTDTDSETGYPMSFRTNLICQANSTKITMQDIYSNPKDYAGFSVKCFAVNRPTIVKTQRGKVFPKFESLPDNFDFASWQGDFIDDKAATELWTSINMDNLHSWTNDADHDNALKLSINVLPNTYGIMSIYVRHTSTDSSEQEQVWLEQIPGAELYSTLGNAVLDGQTITNLSYDSFTTMLPTAYGSTDATDSVRYLLRPGLNCLAINASTTFFVKASANAQGTVSFDDVQLVSTKSSSFGAAQNRTLGLNLAQIGFLPVFDGLDGLDEATVVTNEVREAKKTELSTAFNNASKHISRTASRLFTNQLGNANKNLFKVANQIQQTRDLTTNEDLCDKIIDELSTIAALDDQASLLSIKNTLASSIAIGDNIIKAVDDAEAAKQLTKDIVETQKQLFAVYGDDEAEEVLKKLYTELSYVRGLPQKDNSNKDTASVLQTVGSLNCLTTETIDELKATAERLDVEAKQEYLANIIQELKTPPAHQDYSGALSAVASLYELILDGDGDLRQKAATFKNITNNSALTQLKATLETIKANLEATATVKTDENNKETIEYEDGVEDKIKSIKGLIIAIESGSFEALSDVLGIATDKPTGDISTILTNILSITNGTDDNTFYTIIQQEDDLTDLELGRVKSLIDDLSGTVSDTDYFLETTQAVITFLEGLTAVESQNLKELTASDFVKKYTDAALSNNVCKAVAKVCSTTEGFALPMKDVVYRDFVATKLTQLITAIDSKANCATLNTILTMTNKESACIDNYITDGVKTIISDLRNTCSWTVEAYAGISSLIKNMTNSIGAYSSISNSIPDNVEDDLLQVVIDDLIEALPAKTTAGGTAATDETAVNEARVFFLIQQLRSIVASEKSVLDFIDSRLAAAITNATAGIAEINSTSAIVAALKRTIKNSTATSEESLRTELGTSIATAFTRESNLLSLINRFLLLADPMSLDNFLTSGAESFADTALATVLSEYNNMLSTDEADYEIDPIRAWPGLKADLDLYDGVAGIVKTLMLVNKLFYEQFKDELGNDCAANIDAIFENASLQDVINGIQAIKAKILSGELANDAAKRNMLKELLPAIYELEQDVKDIELDLKTVPKDLEEICMARFTENLLLAELRKLDAAHEFYYNVSVEDSLAIDFNESEEKHNTLMNPAMNYSINNINNSFVISKLDIDHLTKGIQLARSSRLS